MRVAVISRAVFPLHGYGGLERHTGDLVRHLSARGVEVTLITREPPAGQHHSAPELSGVDIVAVPYRTFPLAGRRGTTVLDRSTAYLVFGRRAGRVAADLARQGRVDGVYGLGASALGYALARRRDALVPFVFNPQGLEEFGGPDRRYAGATLKHVGYLPLRRAVRACAQAADRVIATDRAIEPAVVAHLGVPASRVRVVPNAIDLATCDAPCPPDEVARLRGEHGIEPDELLLLSVGRLERNKGLHLLVAALARARDLPLRWVVIGDGPFRRQLTAAVRAARLSRRVVLAGRVGDAGLHTWYEAADLFVHPTLYEGSSLVTLEAMAHRLPVVASTAGGLPDKVLPGVNGWLVTPGDVGALAVALREAARRRGQFSLMGAAGRAIVEREFAWPVVAARMIDLFRELVHC